MDENLTIRKAEPEDCFSVGRMWKALMKEAGNYPVEIDKKVVQNFSIQLLTKIMRDDGDVFIAEYDYNSNAVVPVLVDTWVQNSTLSPPIPRVLNFNANSYYGSFF